MGVLTGPLFSLGARGTISKTLTYSSWRGIKYVRERVIPSNPQSAEQTLTRLAFSNLNIGFVGLPDDTLATWTEDARGRPYTARNRWISRNLSLIRGDANLNQLRLIEPRGLAPQCTNVASADATGQILRITSDDPPNLEGVTFTQALGAATLATQDPSTQLFLITTFEAVDATTPISVDIDVLAAGTYVWAFAWQWLIGGFVRTSPIATGTQVIA